MFGFGRKKGEEEIKQMAVVLILGLLKLLEKKDVVSRKELKEMIINSEPSEQAGWLEPFLTEDE